jgi:hypothetical protein
MPLVPLALLVQLAQLVQLALVAQLVQQAPLERVRMAALVGRAPLVPQRQRVVLLVLKTSVLVELDLALLGKQQSQIVQAAFEYRSSSCSFCKRCQGGHGTRRTNETHQNTEAHIARLCMCPRQSKCPHQTCHLNEKHARRIHPWRFGRRHHAWYRATKKVSFNWGCKRRRPPGMSPCHNWCTSFAAGANDVQELSNILWREVNSAALLQYCCQSMGFSTRHTRRRFTAPIAQEPHAACKDTFLKISNMGESPSDHRTL